MTRIRHGFVVAGIVVALLGLATEDRLVVWLAIGVLTVSVGIRAAMAIAARHREGKGEDASDG